MQYEVQAEQWVRNLDPFRKFLGIAAQANGKILNYTNIAKDVGVSAPTVHSYFDILEDGYIGFRLPAFHNSIRKQQRAAPKFYLFDLGVKRALERSLESRMSPSTSVYGEAFEHFVILEIWRFLKYYRPDAEMSYFLSKDGAEIDLIISQPHMPTLLVEIKSKKSVDERDARHLLHFKGDFSNAHMYILSQDPNAKLIEGVNALHWKEGVLECAKQRGRTVAGANPLHTVPNFC